MGSNSAHDRSNSSAKQGNDPIRRAATAILSYQKTPNPALARAQSITRPPKTV
jgi:hypothetical protein